MCSLDCDELYCETCKDGNPVATETKLDPLELANINYAFARGRLNIQRDLCLQIEELRKNAMESICRCLAECNQSEKKLRALEAEYNEKFEKERIKS